ncbi:MAG: glutathione synthase [Thermodesulfobacteriota bacterium]
MKIAFLMDSLESINPQNETTSYLMYECNQRGHIVYFLESHDIYIRKNEIVARMRNITVPPSLSMKKYWRSLINCMNREERIFENLTDLDALFLRKDPPLVYQIMEFLSSINNQVFMINSTTGQILGNSKLYILNFPSIIPETHVSRDPARLKKIIDDFGGAMVVKPLQGHGGEGVIKVSTRDRENLVSLINYYTKASKPYPEREPIMVQEYMDVLKYEGDIRILLLNGEILGAMRRKACEGDFRTNIHVGGKPYKHEVTEHEKKLCLVIKEKLIRDGLYFVGLDIVGDKLVEINCISPGGIPRINRLNNVKLEAKVIDFIEKKFEEIKQKNP